jgi:methyl-accepting chemotaxis protein
MAAGQLDARKCGNLAAPPDSRAAAEVIAALTALAAATRQRNSEDLDSAIGVSINSSESAILSARLLSAARNTSDRSQILAAASAEMVASVKAISESSQAAAAEASATREIVAEGVVAVQRAAGTMQGIASSVLDASGKVSALSEASEEIGAIVGVIEAIARQTNLLALNATIEAARAGEYGKGFAVVATEVKTLSQQTSKATEDIKSRIEKLRSEMARIVEAMATGAAAVETGRSQMTELAGKIDEAGRRTQTVSIKMEEIASILSEQNAAIDEVSQGITAIAGLASENVEQVTRLSDVIDSSQGHLAGLFQRLAAAEFPNKVVRLAKADHVNWKKRLVDMAVGRATLRADELSDHHSCRLGKWYYSDASTNLKSRREYIDLEAPHAAVHSHGKEAARLFAVGQLDRALAEVAIVEQCSAEVLRLLDGLMERPEASGR